MTLFPMGKVTDYWSTHPLFPIHRLTEKISRDRYLELSMRYRVAPLGHASLWDRVLKFPLFLALDT